MKVFSLPIPDLAIFSQLATMTYPNTDCNTMPCWHSQILLRSSWSIPDALAPNCLRQFYGDSKTIIYHQIAICMSVEISTRILQRNTPAFSKIITRTLVQLKAYAIPNFVITVIQV